MWAGLALVLAPLLWEPIAFGSSEQSRADSLEEGHSPLRAVRVLVASGSRRIRVRAEGEVLLTTGTGANAGACTAADWVVLETTPDGSLRFGDATFASETVVLRPASADCLFLSVFRDGVWTPGNCYPGALRITRDDAGRLEVVNSVDVERYVAGVVASEVWPTFETEAFRAQAIVARTFVLYQMERRQGALHDLKATQSSQVYKGIRTDGTGRRAADAARKTHGLVCVWRDGDRDRLFSAYYSAACGGMSQSAAIFGEADDVPPLRGGVECDFCRIAPGDAYRWGPVRMSRAEVSKRLVSRYPELASLGGLRTITVTERTPAGRPVRLQINGAGDKAHDMLAEHFRFAVGANVIHSTDFVIHVTGDDVVFERGRGSGHGLGLCQWGMQGQALAGRKAAEILRYYYPGSKLIRVY